MARLTLDNFLGERGSTRVQSFSSEEVATLARVTARQLQWWDERGVVSPEHQGHRRRYRLE